MYDSNAKETNSIPKFTQNISTFEAVNSLKAINFLISFFLFFLTICNSSSVITYVTASDVTDERSELSPNIEEGRKKNARIKPYVVKNITLPNANVSCRNNVFSITNNK